MARQQESMQVNEKTYSHPLVALVSEQSLDGSYRLLHEMMNNAEQCQARLRRLWHAMSVLSDQVSVPHPPAAFRRPPNSPQAMQWMELLEKAGRHERRVAAQDQEELRPLQLPFRYTRGNPDMPTMASSVAGGTAPDAAAAGAAAPYRLASLLQGNEGLSQLSMATEAHLLQEQREEVSGRGARASASSSRPDLHPIQLQQVRDDSGSFQTPGTGFPNDSSDQTSLELLSLLSWHMQNQQRLAARSDDSQPSGSRLPGPSLRDPEPLAAQGRSESSQRQHRLFDQAPPMPPRLDGGSDALRDSEAESQPVWEEIVKDPTLPSIGSAGHKAKECKPCLFWYDGLCSKGERCPFCHIPHDGEELRKIRPSKKVRTILKQQRRI